MVENIDDLFAVRKAKFDDLCASGKNPFLANCKQTHTARAVQESFESLEQTRVAVAGRIVVFRLMGKASFIKILDQTGIIQIYVTRDAVGEESYGEFKKFDRDDNSKSMEITKNKEFSCTA